MSNSINNLYANRNSNATNLWVVVKNNDNKYETYNAADETLHDNGAEYQFINGICYSPHNTVSVVDSISNTSGIVNCSAEDMLTMKLNSMFMYVVANINSVGICSDTSVYAQGFEYMLKKNKLSYVRDQIMTNSSGTFAHKIDFVVNSSVAFYINYIINSKMNDISALNMINSYSNLAGIKKYSCADMYMYNNGKYNVIFRSGTRNYINLDFTAPVNYIKIDNTAKDIINTCTQIALEAASKTGVGFICSAEEYQNFILSRLKQANKNIDIVLNSKHIIVLSDIGVRHEKIGAIDIPVLINESLILIVMCKDQITMRDLILLKNICFTSSRAGIIINFVTNYGNGIQIVDCNDNKESLYVPSNYLNGYETEFSNMPHRGGSNRFRGREERGRGNNNKGRR